MIDFIACRALPEKEAEIRREFEDPNSFASKYIEYWGRKAKNALNIDWNQFLADQESPNARENKGKDA